MKRRGLGLLPAAAMAVLFILHQDDWLAACELRVLGLPASLAWHVGLCLASSLVMALAVATAWPRKLDKDEPRGRNS